MFLHIANFTQAQAFIIVFHDNIRNSVNSYISQYAQNKFQIFKTRQPFIKNVLLKYMFVN